MLSKGKSIETPAWPTLLADPQAIAEHVADLSPYELCQEQIEEMYFGYRARLKWTPLSELRFGPNDANIPCEERQQVCDTLSLETIPPLLVDGGMVMDGAHRLRTLQKAKETHCWAYHIEEIPELDYTPGCEP